MSIFVIAFNGYYEGMSPPIQAFADRDIAISVLRLHRSQGRPEAELFEVPQWPHPPPENWWDIKPLEIP